MHDSFKILFINSNTPHAVTSKQVRGIRRRRIELREKSIKTDYVNNIANDRNQFGAFALFLPLSIQSWGYGRRRVGSLDV
jgi:hypothetical protein